MPCRDTRTEPTDMVLGVALPPPRQGLTKGQGRRGTAQGWQVGLAWGSGSGLAKEAKEAEAGIVKVPGGTRVKTLNPWGRS